MLARKVIFLTGLVMLVVHGTAYSAEQSDDVGAFQFLPSLGFSGIRDDNLFGQANNKIIPGSVVRDTLIRVRPQLKLYGREGQNSYSFAYKGDLGKYNVSSDDDYDDHSIEVDFKLDSSMNDLDIIATYAKLHEKRGEGLSEGPVALIRLAPDKYELKKMTGIWELGSESLFGFQLMASRTDIEYTNNILFTETRSREEDFYNARLYVGAGSSTRIFLEYSRENFVHDMDILPGITFDNKEDSYVAGVEWFVTDTTTGIVKIGKTQKDFEYVAVGLEQFDLNIWELEMSWSPVPHSVLTVSSIRQINERNATGTFVVARDSAIKWKHDFTEDMSLSMSVSKGMDFFQNDLRVDDRDEAGLVFEYDMEDTLTIALGFHSKDVDSSNDLFDYDRETYYIEFTLH